MASRIKCVTPSNTMAPIGPYSHVAIAGEHITIGAVAGVDPATGELSGPDVASQTVQILNAFETMLAAAGSDLDHVTHVTVFLADIADFDAMNAAYAERMASRRPARTTIAVAALPKKGARVTMNLTAVTRD